MAANNLDQFGTLTSADADALAELQALNGIVSGSTPARGFDISPMAFQGTSFNADGKIKTQNKGHLGNLDVSVCEVLTFCFHFLRLCIGN